MNETTENLQEPPKPPLGVITEKMWKQQRMKELSRAIGEYLDCAEPDFALISKWTRELNRHAGDYDVKSPVSYKVNITDPLLGSSSNSPLDRPRPGGGLSEAMRL